MELTITEEHIALADKARSDHQSLVEHCPVAYALKELGHTNVHVGYIAAMTTTDSWTISPGAYHWMLRYDRNQSVRPCTLVLEEEFKNGNGPTK